MDGETFQIFSKGVVVEGNVKMIPEIPGDGQTWDLNSLSTDGVIKVVGNPSGIDLKKAENVDSIEYFDLSGMRVLAPEKGAYLMRVTAKDGKVCTRKVMK